MIVLKIESPIKVSRRQWAWWVFVWMYEITHSVYMWQMHLYMVRMHQLSRYTCMCQFVAFKTCISIHIPKIFLAVLWLVFVVDTLFLRRYPNLHVLYQKCISGIYECIVWNNFLYTFIQQRNSLCCMAFFYKRRAMQYAKWHQYIGIKRL